MPLRRFCPALPTYWLVALVAGAGWFPVPLGAQDDTRHGPAASAAEEAPVAPPAAAPVPPSTQSSPATVTAPAPLDSSNRPESPDPAAAGAPDEAAGTLLGNSEEYYKWLSLLTDAIDQIDRNYVEPIDRDELMKAAIEGVLKKLDPYSDYISADEFDDFRVGVDSEFGGIGIQITSLNDQLRVISPLVGTPAYRAGMMAGDRIMAIDGQLTKGMPLADAVKRMKGRAGTDLTLTVLHPHDGSSEDLKITREVIRVDTVLGDRRNKDGSWEFMYDDTAKIGYLRLTAFSKHSDEELRAAVESLAKRAMKGLILDLRFNPGGLLPTAISVSDLFLSAGRIVSIKGRNVAEESWDARPEGTYADFPMAVLVNQYSASASEIVAASLQDHKRAVIVGQRTWGKGSVQSVVDLKGGRSALKITTATYFRPSGRNIHRFEGTSDGAWGVDPTEGFEVELSERETGLLVLDRRRRDVVAGKNPVEDPATPTEFQDRQLARALDYLRASPASPAASPPSLDPQP